MPAPGAHGRGHVVTGDGRAAVAGPPDGRVPSLRARVSIRGSAGRGRERIDSRALQGARFGEAPAGQLPPAPKTSSASAAAACSGVPDTPAAVR